MSIDFALFIYPQGTPVLKDMTSLELGGGGLSKAATGAWALVLLLSAMFGMYRHTQRSPGAGDVTLLLGG